MRDLEQMPLAELAERWRERCPCDCPECRALTRALHLSVPAPSAAPARETPPEHRWIETSDPFTPKCSACGVLDGDPLADQPCAAPPSDAGTETGGGR
jgi:hypothetical protein